MIEQMTGYRGQMTVGSGESYGTKPARNLSCRCGGAEFFAGGGAAASDAAGGEPSDSQARSGGGRDAFRQGGAGWVADGFRRIVAGLCAAADGAAAGGYQRAR